MATEFEQRLDTLVDGYKRLAELKFRMGLYLGLAIGFTVWTVVFALQVVGWI